MRELFPVDGDSLARFLTRWYGPPDRQSVLDGSRAPGPLRDWFEVTSRWSTPVATQNRVLSEPWLEDGKLVFWEENQGAWSWAIDADGDDPPVYDRENVDGAVWQPTGEPLSTFLLHVAVFEAVMGSAFGACACVVSQAQWEGIVAPVHPLPMPDWRWPARGHRLYAADGLLAFGGPNPGPGETAETATAREVWVAADKPARLAYLTKIENLEWDAFTA
ncbi:hypothetical protein V5P93_004230 [Actinokineospora auranticolor]|uniref:SMI1/KNR4 family protein n=1 Tax=Actinokineospora auranticolor TaxID=155976 RepID=A0A2S6GII6_9PSEU|nr:hypothetical protein [Actinokineospora auranticolor]PPK65025.1 hypothetical protein CLV40_11668 [Actinokineospora auranticolor]